MEYDKYCKYYAKLWEYLTKHSKSSDELAKEICAHRNYKDIKRWQKLFRDVGLAKVSNDDICATAMRKSFPDALGIWGSKGFLLENTYMIPVRDMVGNIIALVGWIPGKKYITTASEYFDKSCLFFGLEQFAYYHPQIYGRDKLYSFFIVEGIFDCLALRSLGFHCLGNMGITGSPVKSKLMSLCKKVVAIPDGDSAGQRVVSHDEWMLPITGTYVSIPTSMEDYKIKDVDDIIKMFDAKDVIEYFKTFLKEKERKVTLNIV